MRRLMASMTLVFLWGQPVIADTQWRGGSPDDRAAIGAIIDIWKQGYADGNANVVADGYDPDGYVMAEGAPRAGREQVRANLARTFASNDIQMRLDVMEVEFNGSWAFLAGRFASVRVPHAPDAERRSHAGHFFTLLRKTPGGWKVWRNIDTSSPDAEYLLQQLQAEGPP